MWPEMVSAAMMSAVSSVWMYLLVTEPLAWPTRAAMVTSVKPISLAMLAKKQLASISASVHFRLIISLRRQHGYLFEAEILAEPSAGSPPAEAARTGTMIDAADVTRPAKSSMPSRFGQ